MNPHVVLLLVLSAAPLLAPQDGDPLDKHIADLGDESAMVRESALQALIALGPSAIPRLRLALGSRDVEVRQRASSALCELEREEKLAGVLQARAPVTMSLRAAPFERALQEVARQTGIKFDGAVAPADRGITVDFTRAPLMQVLDGLAAAAGDLQWSFEEDATVYWRRTPPVTRPSCYAGGFKVSLSRIDVYRSWDYQQGHGLMWVYLETRMEPGIRPLGSPRFEVSEIRDEAGNELPRDSETQECSLKGPPREGNARPSGAVYESSPFTINQLDRSVRKLSKIGGRALFLFPLEKTEVQMTDLCEESTETRGSLVFQVSEVLTTSLKLTLVCQGGISNLMHHVDPDTLILMDADGRDYARGKDFEIRVDQMSADTLRYCVEFNEGVTFQPIALRFLVTEQFYEKVVPFEFKDISLP
jgi:hypothetical protein